MRVCASGAVLLRIPKAKPMSFQMSSLSDKSHNIGLSWRFCSYSTSRKILRHPKLEQGTLREGLGLYGAPWGLMGLDRTTVHHSSPCRSGTAVHIDSAGTALHWSSGSTRLRRSMCALFGFGHSLDATGPQGCQKAELFRCC